MKSQMNPKSHKLNSPVSMNLLSLFALLLVATSSLQAQEWATKMFATLEHDFGTVAKNSKQEFRFEFTNLYKEPLHITGVRAS